MTTTIWRATRQVYPWEREPRRRRDPRPRRGDSTRSVSRRPSRAGARRRPAGFWAGSLTERRVSGGMRIRWRRAWQVPIMWRTAVSGATT